VDFTAGVVVLQGRPFGLATVFDVTDRVEAEEARLRMERKLLDSQKLESLGLMAGGVAHDFNNLLAAILGNAELAEELLPANAEARQPLGHIQRACLRAADLTRQMLAYAGRGRFVVEPLDLGQTMESIAGLLRASIPRTIDMAVTPTEQGLLLEGDVAQVQQVILNLVTNAAEAIGNGPGRIRLSAGRRTLTAAAAHGLRAAEELRPGAMVYIEVADTGHGMDAATLDRIFDPFFTTKFTGRGLGLAAMQGIVRGHGGGIAVDSEPGKGTTFRIYFPELPRIQSGTFVAPQL
jgi:signal transduction histidine kinase